MSGPFNTYQPGLQELADKNRARADQESYGFTPSEAASTIYAASMTENSRRDEDAQTRVTSYTYSSTNDASRFIKQVDDRGFNALSDTYFLPADQDEHSRLDKQHTAIVMGLNSLFAEPTVVGALLTDDGLEKKVLDLGCGTGVWTHEMAIKFPHVRVIGVDLAPTPVDPDHVPSNCRFEIDDINKGLEHFKGQIDVAHARLIGAGLQDFRKSVRDVNECIKPGGLVIWMDGDYDIYTGYNFEYLPFATEKNPSGSWFQRIFHEVRRAAIKSGRSDLLGMAETLDAGLWDDPNIDPATCKTASLYLPIGPWATSDDVNQAQQLRYVGALMRQDLMSAHRAAHAVLKKVGWPEAELAEWSNRADDEIIHNTHSMWLRVRLAWGRKRAAPGQPAPPLPVVSTTEDEEHPRTKYPFYFIYDGKEESLRQAEHRNRAKNIPSPPGPPIPT